MNTTSTPRRMFRFRLRTVLLLVALLAIPCAWLGSEWKLVRDRAALIDRIRAAGGYVGEVEAPQIEAAKSERRIVIKSGMQPRPISTIRRWLGDYDDEPIVIGKDFPDDDEKRILDLFPQSEVMKIYPITENRRSPQKAGASGPT